MSMSGIKALVAVAVLGAGGFLGWRWLQDSAKNSTNEELFSIVAKVPMANWIAATNPHYAELTRRVSLPSTDVQKFPYKDLVAKTSTASESDQVLAYHLMGYLSDSGQSALKQIETDFGKKKPTKDGSNAMVFAVKELALHGEISGKDAATFLVKNIMSPARTNENDKVDPEVIKNAVKAMQEVVGNTLDSQTAWQRWINTEGGTFKIEPTRLKKRA